MESLLSNIIIACHKLKLTKGIKLLTIWILILIPLSRIYHLRKKQCSLKIISLRKIQKMRMQFPQTILKSISNLTIQNKLRRLLSLLIRRMETQMMNSQLRILSQVLATISIQNNLSKTNFKIPPMTQLSNYNIIILIIETYHPCKHSILVLNTHGTLNFHMLRHC